MHSQRRRGLVVDHVVKHTRREVGSGIRRMSIVEEQRNVGVLCATLPPRRADWRDDGAGFVHGLLVKRAERDVVVILAPKRPILKQDRLSSVLCNRLVET